MQDESLYVLTASTIFEFALYPEENLDNNSDNNPVLTRVFNFETNLGAEAITAGGDVLAEDQEMRQAIAIFPLPLEGSRRGRLLMPAAGRCDLISREESLCETGQNGLTTMGDTCNRLETICLVPSTLSKLFFLRLSLPANVAIALVNTLCELVVRDCKESEKALCSEERRSERQDDGACCDLPVSKKQEVSTTYSRTKAVGHPSRSQPFRNFMHRCDERLCD